MRLEKDDVSAGGQLPPSDDFTLSDGSLVRLFREGSEKAANRLYRRYARRLRGLARAKASAGLNPHLDADDIVQSVFLRFFTAARKDNYKVPAGKDLWDLLLVITLNKIRSEEEYHRAAKRDVRRTRYDNAEHSVWSAVAERNEYTTAFLRLCVDEALERLAPRYRQIVRLRMEGFEVAEIAEQCQRSKRTVERILHESRAALSQSLIGLDQYDQNQSINTCTAHV
jgi:RNA polymerase sigma-70 factor, ECF subfamily